METKELLKKVKKIEIRSRGLSRQIFSGRYHSAFKGRGMSFSEVREYQYGDGLRLIDWNVTARLNRPYIKIFEEERELSVILLLDVSGSNEFGTLGKTKKQLLAELSAVLSFSALHNNDKVGLIFFSDKIEKFIPPQKGSQHSLRIIREVLNFEPESKGTNISNALRYVSNAIKKRAIVFLLTDFQDNNYEDALKITNRKHDLVGIRVYDKLETEIPKAGLLRIKDPETNTIRWIDSSDKEFRDYYYHSREQKRRDARQICIRSGVDFVEMATNEDYIKPLIKLFHMRESRI
jgi:uncharacterized protein (DUF58 family)